MERIECCDNCAHYDACNNIMKRYTDFGELNKDGAACGYYAVRLDEFLGGDYNLDRLRELVDADKAERCVVLPCKVGDKVWFTKAWFSPALHPMEGKVTGIRGISGGSVLFSAVITENGQAKGNARRFSSEYIGKTVFLTRESAEAALAKEAKGDEQQ